MSRQDNTPRRDPGRRGPPPSGIPFKQRRERALSRPAPKNKRAVPRDPVICRHAASFESADFLQRSAEQTWVMAQALGGEPLFGVSGWIVVGPEEPLPEGYCRRSKLEEAGFRVVDTPHLGRRGHVTILLEDPVSEDQATWINAAFGRERE